MPINAQGRFPPLVSRVSIRHLAASFAPCFGVVKRDFFAGVEVPQNAPWTVSFGRELANVACAWA